ncbi:MAG: bifunctional 3-deoxy-7-phosphoheptulonate synthase/chorismate mutase type II [Saprospiraceae bacterium]|nr:bifunctional 3-deoxy-7-phosphoheptulonate synthase/chorismate mutase type II [Saprospiraceae bacterium]
MEFKPILNATDQVPLLLGPCSAESYEQMEQTIQSCLALNPQIIRAGVWKPRTRPGQFQGMGEIALEWLADLQKKFNIPIATEVANPQHVEACLKQGLHTLWIGARTTVNPFYVQEIADALRGEKVSIMVKNPMNPDLALWIGCIERIYKVGVENIAAIHRGFSFYGNSVYRNVPRWQIPIELRRRLPGLQLVGDISHISGSVAHLREIAQIALDLNYDGLMAEIHFDPNTAKSDADQQVTAEYFQANVFSKLIKRRVDSNSIIFNDKLNQLRNDIDQIDHQLIELLSRRMKIAEQLGLEKKENYISIFQPHRWDEIVERLSKYGKENNLSQEFIFSLIEAIHIESIQHQSKMMNLD